MSTTAPRSFRAILRQVTREMLDRQKRIEVGDVVAQAAAEYGDAFDAALSQLAQAEAATVVRGFLHQLASNDDDQLVLPGLALPSAICVRTAERTYYVESQAAVWDELMAGREERADNVERAQQRLDRYDDTCERLRPFMEGRSGVTVADAVRRLP